MNRRNGSSHRNNEEELADQAGNLNIAAELQIPLPTHVGYYLQKELEEEPQYVDKGKYQLDRELIREINSQEGYLFEGEAVDYQQQNGHNDIFRNTVVLEKFINMTRPRQNKEKLRIFARGGNLCDFLMGTGVTPVSTLEFDYNEEENILRLQKPKILWDIRSFKFSKVGEHRLTGDKCQTIETGRESSYKVMELITEDYELFFSKEVDGFDGDEPIEIRGVMKTLGLTALKIYYRSIALADIIKVVVMISEGEGDDRIRKVSIIDDFSRHDSYGAKMILFKELDKIFSRFIPIFKRVKRGQVSKAIGGMVIIPETAEEPHQNAVVLYQKGFCSDLWGIFGLQGELLDSRLLPAILSGKKLYLCLQNPETFLEILDIRVKDIEMGQIAACFFEYHRNPISPWKRLNDEKFYWAVRDYWREVVHDRNPELVLPLPLKQEDVYACSPFIPLIPFLDGAVYNNKSWYLSEKHNVLIAPLRYDIERLLNTLSASLPKFPRRVLMSVYTQQPCQDLLQNFFQKRITFAEPPPDVPIIFCTIHEIPSERNFRATVFEALNVADVDQRQAPQSAGLYLIRRDDVLPLPNWDNKADLQLLEDFNGLDPIRKFPQKVVLFSRNWPTMERAVKILLRTHVLYSNDNCRWIFISREYLENE